MTILIKLVVSIRRVSKLSARIFSFTPNLLRSGTGRTNSFGYVFPEHIKIFLVTRK